MSSEWEELQPPAKHYGGAEKPPVRFSLTKANGTQFRGRILIMQDLIDQLGDDVKRVTVRLGTGELTHQLRIDANPDGKFELSNAGGAGRKKSQTGVKRVVLPFIEKWPRIKIEVREVKWAIRAIAGKNVLIIDLPVEIWSPQDRARAERRALA
ncbi:hypothetical protein [Labrenzia sp. R5_0]|uniref:hypothetical protein n=1 Tax=Labrenzia sp. R5_0 TaxID=2821108 RepID=UPI001ADB184F|nr:hypothetical protein [Labrenzia sp. R5_0]MBO9458988.1 hypothetical protein [Labrenzia sp. R5_0]